MMSKYISKQFLNRQIQAALPVNLTYHSSKINKFCATVDKNVSRFNSMKNSGIRNSWRLDMQIKFSMAKASKKQKDKAKQQQEKRKIKQEIGDHTEFDLSVHEQEYQHILDEYQKTINTYKVGRLDQTVFINIYVRVGNKNQAVNQLAQIAPKSANVVVLNPYDSDNLDIIQKSLQSSELGFQISKVDKTLVITQPSNSMNEVKKKLLQKLKKQTHNKKQKMNDIRHKAREQLKKYKKVAMEDRVKQIQIELKNLSEKYFNKIDKMAANKEKQLSK